MKITPIESILDNIDFTENEHILKNADEIKEQEKQFIISFVDWCKQEDNSLKSQELLEIYLKL